MNNIKLLKDRRYWPLFWTQFWGAFNDNVFKNALIILITFKAFKLGSLGTEQMVSLCGGLFILPFFLFSAIAGQVADKYSKSKLIYYVKIWEVLVMIAGGIGFLNESIGFLLFALFMMGMQSTFFGPIKYSVIPELLTRDELVKGNALVELGTFCAILVGTILGEILLRSQEHGTTYVAITVITLSLIGTLSSKFFIKLKPADSDLVIKKNPVTPIIEIIKFSMKNKTVWLSILGMSWFWFLGASLLTLFPIYVKNIIGGGPQMVTLLLSLFSIGIAIGSVLCDKFSRERLELGLVPFGSIGMTLFIFDIYLVGSPIFHSSGEVLTVYEFLSHGQSYRILFDFFLLSVFSGFYKVPLNTLIQQRSAEKVRSRIIAANNIINAAFMVGASIFLTFLFSINFSAIQIILVLGLLNAAIAIYIYTVIPEFLMRFACMILTRSVYRLKVTGQVNIPQEGPAVLVCNHVSFVDWLIIAAAIKRPVRFVMYYKFMKIPILKFFFKGAKVIPIAGKKENPELLEKAFSRISKELSNGELVCIFPEGKITADGQLNTYKTGIEKIIARNPVPVVSMTLKGLWGSFFSRKYGGIAVSRPSIIRKTIFSKIELNILPASSSKNVSAQELEDIARKDLPS